MHVSLLIVYLMIESNEWDYRLLILLSIVLCGKQWNSAPWIATLSVVIRQMCAASLWCLSQTADKNGDRLTD